MSSPSNDGGRKEAYEGSVSVIRCGNVTIIYAICVAGRNILKRVVSLCGRGEQSSGRVETRKGL